MEIRPTIPLCTIDQVNIRHFFFGKRNQREKKKKNLEILCMFYPPKIFLLFGKVRDVTIVLELMQFLNYIALEKHSCSLPLG